MLWYHSNGDGSAGVYPDSSAICARIDAGEHGWYGSLDGAIKHGGVCATAYTRKTERVYDAAHWLATGELLPSGTITTTTITAEVAQ